MSDTRRSTLTPLDPARTRAFLERVWEQDAIPALEEYIRIPNRSPGFEPDWQALGHMDRAVRLIEGWCRDRAVPGATVEVVRSEGRTPIILIEVPGTGDETVLLYGHLDKQPEMTGWREGLGPWQPVREGDRLYGRGSADDGYAAFAAMSALEALAEARVPHARAVVLIEACEESGSGDLPHYIERLAGRIGTPSLVICLDSGCGDYRRLWMTTSLRGVLAGELKVEILSEGVHSGDAGGVVADSFRIARLLLSRLEDEASGRILLPELHVEVPEARRIELAAAARLLGSMAGRFPFVPGARPVEGADAELVIARAWSPVLAVTGAAGLPAPADAGNVLRPQTTLKLALRLPPTCDAARAAERVRETLEADPPYGARVSFRGGAAAGWTAPPVEPWLEAAVDEASRVHFGEAPAHLGEGGSIPFMAMLGARFPSAQFLITGVLGPDSNAHGPNEYLHVPTAKRLTASVAAILAAHRARG